MRHKGDDPQDRVVFHPALFPCPSSRSPRDRARWLWTFVSVQGVEPTNNEGERSGRRAVLWRKTSGGTDSPQGSRFVERVLTVIDTCRKQGKKALEYLCDCVRAWRHGRAPPFLVACPS